MNIQQVDLVQQMFTLAVPHAETIAHRFYQQLFEFDPTLRALFPDDMSEQEEKLMTMLAFVVHGLGQPEQMYAAVGRLGQRHEHYGVQTHHYALVGNALLATLAEHFGPAFTPDVKEAWTEAYTMLSSTMQESTRSSAQAQVVDSIPER